MATIEKLDHDKVRLTIEIDADTFAAADQQAYVKNAKNFNIPGFRKGKAPKKVIETQWGEGVFFEDAFDICWGDAYDDAIEEFELVPVDKPSITINKMSKEEGVEFVAEVQLQPTVKLGKYKGLEVEKPDYSVKEEEVDKKIEEEREKNARFVDVDRAAENGDRVIIDYAGTIDGVAFDGGTAEGQTLVLGSGAFIPGFEDQVVGMKIDEERDVKVQFPKDYPAEELAGKDAVFAVKLHAVQLKELPALDDEFAKDVSEFDTLKEYKDDIRAKMKEQAEKNEKTAIENIAIKAACENAEMEIPDCMVERQMDFMVEDFGYKLQMSGISFDDYCNYFGSNPQDMREQFREEAKARVKMQLVIGKIVEEEKLTCSDEELQEVIKGYADENKQPVEEFEKAISEDDREYLRRRKATDKAIQLIVDSLKFKAAKKTAAKKPAAKKEEDSAEKKPAAKKAAAKKPAEKKPAAKKPAAKKKED